MRSRSFRLVWHRLLQAVPVMLGVTFITFSAVNLLPGSTAEALLGDNATPQAVEALTIRLHQDQPFLLRYWNWLSGLATGNFGDSLAGGQPIASILGTRLPVTLELVTLAMLISIATAVPLALLAARRGGLADRISLGVSMIGISVPNFAIGLLLILLFAVQWRLLPALGYVPLNAQVWPNLRTMILPALAIAYPLFCHYTRILRADLIDQLQGEDYVITAKAKGLAPNTILVGHVLRNSIFSLVTMVGLNFGVLVGGTVIIEQVFALPGMGQALVQAITVKDVPVVQAIVVCMSIAVVAASVVTDLLYAALDPRISSDARIA